MRLAIAGLGAVWPAHQAAASSIGLCPTVGFDPDPERRRSAGIETTDSLEALLSQPLDGLVVATSDAAHRPVAEAALKRGIPVLLEKPVVTDAAQLDLLGPDWPRGLVHTSLHAAYSPDVTWFASRRADLEAAHGPVIRADACFEHPYPADDPRDPWLDVGINALTVLSRVLGPLKRQGLQRGLHATDCALSFEGGIAQVHAGRDRGVNNKETRLTLKDGTQVRLHHSRHTVWVGQRALFSRTVPRPRLAAHYPGVYRDWARVLLSGGGDNRRVALELHRLLLV